MLGPKGAIKQIEEVELLINITKLTLKLSHVKQDDI